MIENLQSGDTIEYFGKKYTALYKQREGLPAEQTVWLICETADPTARPIFKVESDLHKHGRRVEE